MKPIPQQILDICWAQLMEYKEWGVGPSFITHLGPPDLYLQDGNAFTYLGFGDDIIITEDMAKEKLATLIEEAIKTQNKVFLYTCGDNSIISIELIPEDEMEEALNCFEEEELEGPNPTNIKFYIGYD